MARMLKPFIKLSLFNVSFNENEQSIKYKFIFLNSVYLFAGIAAFSLGFIRWQGSVLLGSIDFGFSAICFAQLFYLRYHKEKVEIMSTLALILSFILFFSIYLLAPYNKIRLALFLLLLASAFFLKGRKKGFLWLIFISLAIVVGHITFPSGSAYLNIDIVTTILYLMALFFIFDNYELVKEDQSKELENLNIDLEKKIQDRTKELEQANKGLTLLDFHNNMLIEHLKQSEQNFRNIIENAPIGTAILSSDGKFIKANRVIYDHLGYDKDELQGITIQELIHPEDRDTSVDMMHMLLNENIPTTNFEKRLIRKNKSILWAIINLSLIIDKKDDTHYFIVQVVDITDRIENEKKMIELNKVTSTALNEVKIIEHNENLINKLNSMLQVCVTPEEAYPRIRLIAQELFKELSGGLSTLNKLNEQMETVIEWGDEKILKQSFLPSECFGIRLGKINIVDDPQKAVPCPHYLSIPQGGYMGIPLFVQNDLIGVIHLFAPANKIVPKNLQEIAITFADSVKVALSNIKLRESLHELALKDPLTGLVSHHYLIEYLAHELDRIVHEKKNLIAAMIEVDSFKRLNDAFGYHAGDEVLKFIAATINKIFDSSDIACRFGDNKFFILMHECNIKDAMQKLEKLVEIIKDESLTYREEHLPHITLSVGVAEAPQHGHTEDILLAALDKALNEAKKADNNKIRLYQSTPSVAL